MPALMRSPRLGVGINREIHTPNPRQRWQDELNVHDLVDMPASSNFQEAIREAQSSALVGPNVVNKALPYVGGGMALTSVGVIGGLSMMATPLFMPLFWVAMIGNLILFFVAQNVAMKGNNATALPLLAVYSLITGFTLSGLVAFAGAVAGIGAVGTAALATVSAGRTLFSKRPPRSRRVRTTSVGWAPWPRRSRMASVSRRVSLVRGL